jgi:hypothetical protein
MPDTDRHKEVLEEKRLVTGRISETTRYIGFGLLAAFYGIVSSSDPFPKGLMSSQPVALKLMASSGFLAVFLDYLQYVSGRIAVQAALDRPDKPFQYNKRWLSYRVRRVCFVAKQGAALAGSVAFIWIVLVAT